MTFPGYSFCGFNDAGLVEGRSQRALLGGRRYLVQRIQVYTPPGFFPTPTIVRPFVIPWTLASDRWGVAYPAGIWGVTEWVSQLTPAGDPFTTEWAQLWEYTLKEQLGRMVAVPQVLPIGYTPRLKRDWHADRPRSALREGYVPDGASSGYRIRNASGYTSYPWVPDSRVWGTTGIQVTSSGASPSIGSKYFGRYDTGIGYRKVQIEVQYLDLGGVPWTGAAAVRLSHNAAGPGGVVTTEGDTSDYAIDFPYSSFTGGGLGTTYSTGWIDIGQILPTAGNVTDFKASMDLTSIAGMFTFGVVLSFRLSPRCDVPLPFTVTNRGNTIAPGGLL